MDSLLVSDTTFFLVKAKNKTETMRSKPPTRCKTAEESMKYQTTAPSV